MKARRQALFLVLALSAFSGVTCRNNKDATKEAPPVPSIADRLRVSWRMRTDGAFELKRDAVTRMAHTALASLRFPKLTVTGVRLLGELAVDEKQGVLTLECRLSIRDLPVPIVSRVAATGAASDEIAITRMVEAGLKDVANATSDMLSLVGSGPEALKARLQAAESDIQILAAKLIGIRKPDGAATALCPLLTDPRQEVAEAAAEALIAVKDPKCISCVINTISKGSLRSEVRAIEIMGQIGGPEAIAYLEMTSLGHEMPEVRLLSETLLKSLRASAQAKNDRIE